MAVASSDLKLRVDIESAAKLAGVTQTTQGLGGVTERAAAAQAATEKFTSKFSSGADVAKDSIDGMNKALQRVVSEVESMPVGSSKFAAYSSLVVHLRSELDAAKKSMQGLDGSAAGKSAGRNLQVLQDMGRIFQDMPYGIVGIGNNIQPLVESFGRAKSEAGGTSDAVKGILAGIAGPAGLAMVGIPIVTSLAIAFGDKFAKGVMAGGESLDEMTNKLDALGKYKDFALQVKISGLEGVARLKAELLQLMQQKAFLEGSSAVDKAVQKAQPGWVERLMTSMSEGGSGASRMVYDPVVAAKKAQDKYYQSLAADIRLGKGSTGDTKYDASLLNKYYPEIKAVVGEAERILAINQKNLQISENQSKTALTQKKEDEKVSRKSGDSALAVYNAQVTAWNSAFTEADKLLNADDIKESLPKTVAGATAAVESIRSEIERLQELGDAKNTDKLRELNQQFAINKQNLVSTTSAWESANKKADEVQRKTEVSNLSVVESHKAVQDATTALATTEFTSAQEKVAAAEKVNIAREQETKAMADQTKQMELVKSAWQSIGALVGGGAGAGLAAVMNGVSVLGADTSKMTDAQKTQNAATGYSAIASGVGQAIGGKTGSAISSASSDALAGFTIGGPVVAAVGGIIGLASSLFGGNNDQQRQQDRQNALAMTQSIAQMASSGNHLAQAMMSTAGYNATTLANLESNTYSGKLSGKYATPYNADLLRRTTLQSVGNEKYVQDALNAIGQIETAISSFANTSIVDTLQNIDYKWAAITATVGSGADIAMARMSEVIVAVTGVSANSVSTMINDAINSAGNGQAGAAFAAKFEESLASSIRQMAISQLVNSTLMPMLQPVMMQIVNGLVGGNLSTESMDALYGKARMAALSLSPAIDAMSQAFTDAGLSAAQTIVTIRTEAASMVRQLYTLLGDSAALRALDLANVSAENQALQLTVWAMDDAGKSVTSALSGLQKSIDAQKAALEAQYNATKSALDAQKTTASDTVSKLSTLSGSLKSALSSLSLSGVASTTRAAAQADIRAALAAARTTGVLPVDGQLTAALSAIAQPSTQMFGSFVDYARDFYRTAADLSSLSSLTDGQLSVAQQQLSVLEEQLKVLESTYNVDVSSLQGMYDTAVQQVNELSGIKSGVSSVDAAIQTLSSVMISYAAASQASVDAIAAQKAAEDAAKAAAVKAAADAQAAAQAAAAAEAARVQRQYAGLANSNNLYDAAHGLSGTYWNTSNIKSLLDAQGQSADAEVSMMWNYYKGAYGTLPAYADGGYFAGGYRLVGEKGPEIERTGPSRIYSNSDTKSIFNIDALIDEIRQLRSEMRAGNGAIAFNTLKTYKMLDLQVNGGGH